MIDISEMYKSRRLRATKEDMSALVDICISFLVVGLSSS